MADGMEDDSTFFFLCEMFDELDPEIIHKILKDASTTIPERLVDLCLEESSKLEQKSEGHSNQHQDGEYECTEMISLLPAFASDLHSGEPEPEPGAPMDTEDDITVEGEDQSSDAIQNDEKSPSDGLLIDEETQKLQAQIISHVQTLRENAALTSVHECIKTVIKCLSNILTHPLEAKYRTLRLQNESFQKKVGRLEGGIDLLKSVGFYIKSSENALILERDDYARLYLVKSILEDQLTPVLSELESRKHQTGAPQGLSSSSRPPNPVSSSRPGHKKHSKAPERLGRQKMADIHERRLRQSRPNKSSNRGYSLPALQHSPQSSSGLSDKTVGGAGYYKHMKDVKERVRRIRSEKHRKWKNTPNARKRMYTLADIDKLRMKEANSLGTGSTADKIGKESLRQTNEFRKKHKLPELMWHQALAKIGQGHSKDMSTGKVPFGHQGFNERVRWYPFASHSAAENVAMSNGIADVAKCAVDGWIDSPGHRKNLLSNHNYCGIGVYQGANGAYYLTQLFGRT